MHFFHFCILSLLRLLAFGTYSESVIVKTTMFITVDKCSSVGPLLPGSTRTVVGQPVEPENFLSSVQVLMVSWIKGLPPRLDRWRVRLGMSRRRTSSGCAVPHCGSNSMVVQRTQSGNDTWGEVRWSKISWDLNYICASYFFRCKLLISNYANGCITLYCVTPACL